MRKPGPRTRQALWNVKQQRPELFARPDHPRDEPSETTACDTVVPPLGFEACEREGWLHNPGRGAFFEVSTGRLCWFDERTGEYRDLRQGKTLAITFAGSATTRLDHGGDTVVVDVDARVTQGVVVKQSTPRHVVIPDLHRAGQALRMELDHLDRPAAMLGVFGSCEDAGSSAPPVETTARGLHERLIRRLFASRGEWAGDALLGAVSGAMVDIAASYGGVWPVAAVALLVGHRIAAVAAPGAQVCLFAGSSASSATSCSRSVAAGGASVCFGELASGDPLAALSVALAVGEVVLDDAEIVASVEPQLHQGRARAASVALLRAAREGGNARGPLAAACARLAPAARDGNFGPPQEQRPVKRFRGAEDAARKVRVSQILLRHWRGGAGACPMDPVRRKPVTRTPEEAEEQLLGVLDGLLVAGGRAGFSGACKAVSECQSALKGGELAGDLGWLDQQQQADTAPAQPGNLRSANARPALPAPVLKVAFSLEVGEVSDLVSSDVGAHLLMRTA